MKSNCVNHNQQNKVTFCRIIEDLLSYLMGVVFNRYQIDNYVTSLNVQVFNEIKVVTKEIKFLIIHKMGIDGLKQLETLLGHLIDDYFKDYYGKNTRSSVHNLPFIGIK